MAKKQSDDEILKGLKTRKISLPALRKFANSIKKAAEKKSAPDLLQSQKFNLKVFETQLKSLEDAMEGELITSDSFLSLPAHQQKKILTRLENIKKRAEKKLPFTKEQAVKFDSQPFTCLSDFEKCRKLKSVTPFWCHFAFYVCVLRSMVPFMK